MYIDIYKLNNLKINDIIILPNNTKLQVKIRNYKNYDCNTRYFYNKCICSSINCSTITRKDNTSIIFLKIN